MRDRDRDREDRKAVKHRGVPEAPAVSRVPPTTMRDRNRNREDRKAVKHRGVPAARGSLDEYESLPYHAVHRFSSPPAGPDDMAVLR